MTGFPSWTRPVAIIAALFGLASIISGGKALFGGATAAAAVGNAVPFVLWFNFLAGFIYILGAAALYLYSDLAKPVAWALAISTLAVFAVLLMMVFGGVPFEMRTIGAMVLRSGFWLIIAFALTRFAAGRQILS